MEQITEVPLRTWITAAIPILYFTGVGEEIQHLEEKADLVTIMSNSQINILSPLDPLSPTSPSCQDCKKFFSVFEFDVVALWQV